jgi:hypothetical protein
MENLIKNIRLLAVISPVVVILLIYFVDINSATVKSLVAGAVTVICALQFYLLDKLEKENKK